MSWFVHPATTIVTLEGGDTLVVKTDLNMGETRDLHTAMQYAASANGDGPRRVDPNRYPLALVVAYLVDWSITDEGRPVPLRDQAPDGIRATLDNLFPDKFLEIFRAIEAHVARRDETRAAEKKTTRIGATGSPPISPSPSAAAGATNGSPSSTPTSMTSSSPS